MQGETVEFSTYKDKVLLIVNTASKCGFTSQFKGLEELYLKYKDQGFEVLGFPCNQFKHQDPGNNEEILGFCELNYGVTFPMFQKIDVNGQERHHLYKYLIKNNKENKKGDVKWNFEKFVISPDGEIIERFASLKTPKAIEKFIVNNL